MGLTAETGGGLRLSPFSSREIIAIETWINGTILDEVLRLTKALAIVISAVAAGLIPPSNGGNPVTPTAIVLTGMIFYIGCAVALGSYLAAARRRRIVKVRRELPEAGVHHRRATDLPMPMAPLLEELEAEVARFRHLNDALEAELVPARPGRKQPGR